MFIPSNLLSPLLLATTLALSTTTVSAQDVTAGSCSGTVDRPACSSLSQPDLQRLFSCHQQLKDSGALNPLLDQHSVTDWNAAHFNCLFLHWHRAFLRKFEILLKGTCPDVNLCWLDYYTYPEWWTHPVFSIPSSEPREPRQNAIQEQIDAVFLALLKPTFSEFCFLMEVSGTHAAIHMNLGGTMATARSPADPVFFLHHASLDYIWSKWEGTHPSAAFECAYYQRQESMFPPQHSAYNRWEATQNLPSFTFSPSSIMSSSNICVNYLEPGAAAARPAAPARRRAVPALSASRGDVGRHFTRSRYSLVRVSIRIFSPGLMNGGTWTLSPVSSVASLYWLVAVAPWSAGGVSVTHSSTESGISMETGLSLMYLTETLLLGSRNSIAVPMISGAKWSWS
ncbi:hypothetical protein HK102_006997 [Quaeritorhiza haematococci]|nr:hypothetical protein HK102_006997 [Quaeritorhiza haematococci]